MTLPSPVGTAYYIGINSHPPLERILAIDWANEGFSATIKTVLILKRSTQLTGSSNVSNVTLLFLYYCLKPAQ